MSKSRAKGTRLESDIRNAGLDLGLDISREPMGARWDLTVRGSTGRTIEALATRPDFGKTLVSIPLADFLHLLVSHGDSARIECKRYAKFAHHSIYTDTFSA